MWEFEKNRIENFIFSNHIILMMTSTTIAEKLSVAVISETIGNFTKLVQKMRTEGDLKTMVSIQQYLLSQYTIRLYETAIDFTYAFFLKNESNKKYILSIVGDLIPFDESMKNTLFQNKALMEGVVNQLKLSEAINPKYVDVMYDILSSKETNKFTDTTTQGLFNTFLIKVMQHTFVHGFAYYERLMNQ